MTSASNEELSWLLERFVDRTPGAAHVVGTVDGLHLAGSQGMPRER